ncbi:MAG: hypothetical protein NZ556_00515 [Fimbriimonadales bacterium]|nr:hypothetical protein [Fimbriimonadales bacterium]
MLTQATRGLGVSPKQRVAWTVVSSRHGQDCPCYLHGLEARETWHGQSSQTVAQVKYISLNSQSVEVGYGDELSQGRAVAAALAQRVVRTSGAYYS